MWSEAPHTQKAAFTQKTSSNIINTRKGTIWPAWKSHRPMKIHKQERLQTGWRRTHQYPRTIPHLLVPPHNLDHQHSRFLFHPAALPHCPVPGSRLLTLNFQMRCTVCEVLSTPPRLEISGFSGEWCFPTAAAKRDPWEWELELGFNLLSDDKPSRSHSFKHWHVQQTGEGGRKHPELQASNPVLQHSQPKEHTACSLNGDNFVVMRQANGKYLKCEENKAWWTQVSKSCLQRMTPATSKDRLVRTRASLA